MGEGQRQGLPAVHHCEACGYELTGLGETGECPECGRPFNAWVPFVSGRPIAWGRELVRMAWPGAGAAAGLVVLMKLLHVWAGAGMLLPAMFLAWIGLAMGFPVAVSREVGERHWTIPHRGRRVVAVGLAGIAVNVAILAVLLVVARAF